MTFRSKKLFFSTSLFTIIILILCVCGYWTFHSMPNATPHFDSIAYHKMLLFQSKQDSLSRAYSHQHYRRASSSYWDSIHAHKIKTHKWQERIQKKSHKHGKEYYITHLHKLHTFNPNTTDSSELKDMGFAPFLIHGLLSYKKAGGIFTKKMQLALIYGMDSTTYSSLKPYIYILPQKKKQVKIALNSQDTNQWIQVPQIAIKRAKSIIQYGQQLGGYSNKAQLKEVWSISNELYTNLYTYVVEDSIQIRPIRINYASFRRLFAHPYINYYQAEALYNLRIQLQHIDSLQQLFQIPEFTQKDIIRLKPYLNFTTKK